MDTKELIELMKAVEHHQLTEFQLEQGGTKILMKRKAASEDRRTLKTSESGVDSMVYTAHSVENSVLQKETGTESGTGNRIISPLVGTFYSAPAPDAEDYVKVGDRVKKGQIVGIVEAMKLLNEIESDFDGIVEEILVQNETTVEYGQPLFRIR